MDKVWLVVAFVMSLAWACGGVWFAFAEVMRSRRAKVWPSVIGQVLDSQVRVGGDEAIVYHVEIEYQYSVFGHPYKGSESIFPMGALWALSGKASREEAEDVCDSYRVGQELKLAYNPKRPNESTIANNDRRRVNKGMILAGSFMFMTGLLGIFLVAVEAP